MKKKRKEIELMAPAGSFPALTAACKAGADAVYIGLNAFSMRAGKKNFKLSDLGRIRKICNSYSRKPKIYVTLNTIVYDSELKKLASLIKKLKSRVDAVICWDLGVIKLCKENDLPFFISTQASVANKSAAEFYKELGAKRVVLARELSMKQVREIAKIEGIDIEVFIHGAMCVSVSGRCYISQFLSNRSANRGECFQPCRRSYTVRDNRDGYELKLENDKIISTKDLCTLPFIRELKRLGVDSFKIEGRNRDPRYVDTVVRVYRRAIDEDLSDEELIALMKELQGVYNRGFSSGFYLGKPLPTDFSVVDNSASDIRKEFIGKIVHIYPKIGVGLIKLSNNLSDGEEITIIHDNMGVETMKVSRLEINKKKIKSAKKGEEVALKFPFKIFKGAEVYKLKRV